MAEKLEASVVPTTYGLRYRGHDLWIAPGAFVIGRQADCQLVVDDPLVSRRHARIVVSRHGVSVEDLGSANGVFINGQKAGVGPHPVKPGDFFAVGSEEIEVLPPRAVTERPTVSTRQSADAVATQPGSKGVVISEKPPEMTGGATGQADAVDLMGRVAEKAIAAGRLADAERRLQAHLENTLASARERALPDELLQAVSRYALKLAVATKKGQWFDYVTDLFAAQKEPFPGAVLVDLQVTLGQVDAVDCGKLEAYVDILRDKAPASNARSRQLLVRAEELLAAAKAKQSVAGPR